MKVSDFTHAVNLRKLNEILKGERRITATFTHFAEDQHYLYGRNGASNLVTFAKTVYESDSIYIDRPWRGNYVTILIHSRVSAGQSGFGTRMSWRLIYKKDGKQRSIDITDDSFRTEDFAERNDSYLRLFDDLTREKIKADPYNWRPDASLASHIRLKAKDATTECNKIYDALVLMGLQPIALIPYTAQLRLSVRWVDVQTNSVEIGWYTNATYNSLPCSLKIQWSKDDRWDAKELIKCVDLSSIGVEQPGYYAHTDKMKVLPEQVESVKRFSARFNRKAKDK